MWRKCSSCKKPIDYGSRYYVCSVSTCNGPRTGYVFCSVSCFEVHLPTARHKDAAAIEMKADMKPNIAPAASAETLGTRRIVASAQGPSSSATRSSIPRDVLIIASRLKDYIQARSEMNTSGNVMDILSDHVRVICDRAIDHARADGRKTVMERDFEFLKNSR